MVARYTGRPCKRGHSGERYKANRACVTCENERLRQKRLADSAWARRRDAKTAAWGENNPLARSIHQADYRLRKLLNKDNNE